MTNAGAGSMIAALYVLEDGPYSELEGVDLWPESRDARLYPGPHPVIAHPPCARWCQLASVVEARYGYRIGDDGGTFESALAAVRKWGGVLEHPAETIAWGTYGLPRPQRGGWIKELFGPGWVTEAEQGRYGHLARKRTWLYAVGVDPLPRLDWGRAKAKAYVGYCSIDDYPGMPRISGRKSLETPKRFKEVLVAMARAAKEPKTEDKNHEKQRPTDRCRATRRRP